MKKIILTVFIMVVMISSSSMAISAFGSAFGTLTTAQTLGMGRGNLGAGVGFADATSVVGSFNYGLSAHTDGRLRLALVDADNSDTKFAFSADFKYQIMSVNDIKNGPFDMALGAFGEYYNYERSSIFEFGGQIIGSYPVKLEKGMILTPYGRFNVRLESISWDDPLPSGDDSETNLEFGLNGGVKWTLTKTIDLYGEFQIDGNDGVFLGIDFNIL